MQMLQGVWKQHLRPHAVVGYGVKIFLPSPPNYVTRSPGGEKVSKGKCHYYCSCFIISFRCYLVDNLANLVTDPDFLLVSTKDAREYERVSLGRKEGDIMKLLVAKYKLFVPNQRVDFQGICSVSPYAPKVCFVFALLWSSTIRYWR